MWINPNTDKGWTDTEEAAFTAIVQASRLGRIQAIHLWKRCRKNANQALHLAKTQYPKLSQAVLQKLAKARTGRKRAIAKTETALGKDLFSPGANICATRCA